MTIIEIVGRKPERPVGRTHVRTPEAATTVAQGLFPKRHTLGGRIARAATVAEASN